MELIQPFINAADAVLSQGLQSPMEIGNLTMMKKLSAQGHCGDGEVSGDIEGRIIFDLDPKTAARMAAYFRHRTAETDSLVREAVAN